MEHNHNYLCHNNPIFNLFIISQCRKLAILVCSYIPLNKITEEKYGFELNFSPICTCND